jgi:hypothetical protein
MPRERSRSSLRAQCGGDFIAEQDLGPHHQRTGNRHTLPFTTGQLGGAALDVVCHPHFGKGFMCPGPGFLRGDAKHLAWARGRDFPAPSCAATANIAESLTLTIHHGEDETGLVDSLTRIGLSRSGRVIFNGYPTGVAVSWAQTHGGPWPSTNTLHTSVGATAIRRFLSSRHLPKRPSICASRGTARRPGDRSDPDQRQTHPAQWV